MPKGKLMPRSLSDLKPAPYNPREITPEALAGLKTSLHEFGDISGIVWNSRTGHIVAGHQRLEALRAKHGDTLKIKGGDVVTPTGERFPIRVVEWPVSKEQAANLAANNPAITGEFTSGVENILQEIEDGLPDLFDGLNLGDIGAEVVRDLDVTTGIEDLAPPRMDLQPFESYDFLAFVFRDSRDFNAACAKFGAEQVNTSPIAGKKKIGLGRVLDGKVLLDEDR